MDLQEPHSGLWYRTLGGESPQGKPKVYFSAHPRDFSRYFEEICADILRYRPECAIFYGASGEALSQQRQEVLAQMQLFVMPVSSALLTEKNSVLDLEFPFALEHKIPVLPLMQEPGLEEIFNLKCGELQFLDKTARDATAIPYGEKLKSYLESVLISDEMARKIRAAFDAYIFLSYRKKDRKYAQALMRMVHENEDFRDIAIWYDEFLVPGENFNQAIGEALQRCNVFTLLVTPNLVNEPNYVQQNEYPEARHSGKPILPVEAVPTDRSELERQYPAIPPCAHRETLSREMYGRLGAIALKENDSDPMHLFFIGLAYLGGVDVERNPERAEALLTRAANLGLPEACEKLAQMYNTGEGVERNYRTAALWFAAQARLLKALWEQEGTPAAASRYFFSLLHLGDAWSSLEEPERAWEAYTAARLLAEQLLQTDPTKRACLLFNQAAVSRAGAAAMKKGDLEEAEKCFRRSLELSERLAEREDSAYVTDMLGTSCQSLGDLAEARGRLREAMDWHRKALALYKDLAEKTNTIQARITLATVYSRMGRLAEDCGQLRQAEDWYRQLLELSRELTDATGDGAPRRSMAAACEGLGNLAVARGELQEAKTWYRQLLELSKALTEETEAVDAREDLAASYGYMGHLAEMCRNLPEAEAWYRKHLKIAEALARDTGAETVRHGLAIACITMGDITAANGKLSEAESRYRRALDLFEALARENRTPEAENCLSLAYERMGNLAKDTGRLSEAERWYRKRMELAKALAEKIGTAKARKDLALSYSEMGELAKELGRLPEAMDWYRQSLEITQALAVEIRTVEARRDLEISCSEMGDIAKEMGKLSEAELWYRHSFKMAKVLAREINTVDTRRDLEISFTEMGDIAKEQGKLSEAKDWYRKALEMAQALDRELGTIESKNDLADACRGMGDILKDSPEAERWYRRDLELRQELAEDSEAVSSRSALALAEANLGEFLMRAGQTAQAKALLQKALDLAQPLTQNAEAAKVVLRCRAALQAPEQTDAP